MLYSEFINGTGCKDNDHNYEVFKNLEVMYMNTDMTKDQIYEYGKKLVDNSKSEKEIAFEKEIKDQIEAEKKEVAYWTERAEFYLVVMEDKAESKRFKQLAKEHKQNIAKLRFVLS